jgi:hypothetical protein
MLKEAYESVVEIAFENAENKEKVKRKKKYVKNKSVSKKIKKISSKRFFLNRVRETSRIFGLVINGLKKLRRST